MSLGGLRDVNLGIMQTNKVAKEQEMTEQQKEQIRQMRDEGKGYKAISSSLDIPLGTVKTFCRRDKETDEKTDSVIVIQSIGSFCKGCGVPITSKAHKKAKQFCSDKCRMSWWNSHRDLVQRKAIYGKNCVFCNKPFTTYGKAEQKFCSLDCYQNWRKKDNGRD